PAPPVAGEAAPEPAVALASAVPDAGEPPGEGLSAALVDPPGLAEGEAGPERVDGLASSVSESEEPTFERLKAAPVETTPKDTKVAALDVETADASDKDPLDGIAEAVEPMAAVAEQAKVPSIEVLDEVTSSATTSEAGIETIAMRKETDDPMPDSIPVAGSEDFRKTTLSESGLREDANDIPFASNISDGEFKDDAGELDFALATELEAESLLTELAFLDTGMLEPTLPDLGKSAVETSVVGPPTFDIVRVDRHGTAIVAGSATPLARVDVIVDGTSVITAVADRSGQFAVTFDVEAALGPIVISLLMKAPGVPALESVESVIVVVPQTSLPLPPVDLDPIPEIATVPSPAVLLASTDSIDLLQPGFETAAISDFSENVTIDAIYYDEEGEVVLSGRGKPGKSVIVYVDGNPEINEPVGLGGDWSLPLSGIDAGRYTLRIDEVDDAGIVYSRVETPFQKEMPELVLQKLEQSGSSAEPGDLPRVTDDFAIRSITVQPGYTLWGISRSRYGLGRYYVRIYAANKEQIRDPDLIYPGQVFVIPD
ncbi:MAG: LysM peptidoglycan-binding domain-containing protein, partial [Albidovulum sp.]|nr:LysM peptidoglycan-binding domain-containing protein [Albidovulum sp.]